MKNIVLVGFMGTGKSAVARQLAKDLGKKYISLDEEIVEREGRPINDIFSNEGEPYFRQVEKEIVEEFSKKTDLVIDTGGGVVLDNDNMNNLKSSSMVVCLWATPETIYERTQKQSHRPLLKVEDPMGRIRDLLEYRRPFYQKAEVHIDTDVLSIPEIVEEVKKHISDKESDG